MPRDLLGTLLLLGRHTAEIVLPSPCVACGEPLPLTRRVASCCVECWSALPKIVCGKCSRCGIPASAYPAGSEFTCGECFDRRTALNWIDAWGRYDGALERVLQAFKFQRHDFLAADLATLLYDTYVERGEEFDLITAVPMHRSRERRRGYNQAELLATELAKLAGVPFDGTLLTKREDREPQSTLPKDQRRANVRHLFEAGTRATAIRVLIIDDICTTGETLRACAAALSKTGAKRICAIAVARA
jgi:ComF family protein